MSALPDGVTEYLRHHYANYRLSPLTAGLNNRVFRLQHGNQVYVLRLHRELLQPNQSSRQHEQQAWQLAAQAGLAPPLLHWSAEHSFSISRFMPQIAQPKGLVTRLQQLHSLSMAGLVEFDYQARLAEQLAQLGERLEQGNWLLRIQDWVRQMQLSSLPSGLTHHDLNRSNLLFAESGVCFIDFEYVASGHPLWDLAACHDALTPDDNQNTLWQQYLALSEVAPTAVEAQAWAAANRLYHLSCWLWFQQTGIEPQQARYHYQKLIGNGH